MIELARTFNVMRKRRLTPDELADLTVRVLRLESEHADLMKLAGDIIESRYGSSVTYVMNRNPELVGIVATVKERLKLYERRDSIRQRDNDDGSAASGAGPGFVPIML